MASIVQRPLAERAVVDAAKAKLHPETEARPVDEVRSLIAMTNVMGGIGVSDPMGDCRGSSG